MTISDSARRELSDLVKDWDRAMDDWRADTGADEYATGRRKHQVILAAAGIVGYLKGLGVVSVPAGR